MLVNFLVESFIILHDYLKLGILVDRLQRFHIGVVQQRKLDVESGRPLK